MRLGLSNPSANTDVAIYTATGPFLASIIATNKSASATSNIRIWIVPDGATTTSEYAYLAYDQDIVPQNSLETHRFALNQNDVVYVRADTADMSFIINGLKQVDIALAAGVTSYSDTAPLDLMDGMIWVDKDGNGTSLNTLAGQVIQSSASTQVPLTLQGASSQTVDLLDIKDSSGTDLVSVSSAGIVNATNFTRAGINAIPTFASVVSNGALGTNYSFTVPAKSQCFFLWSSSGYSGGAQLQTWTILINDSSIGTHSQFFNTTSDHEASQMAIATSTLNAGTYNAKVNFTGMSDANDFVTIFAIMVPVA